MKRCFEKISFNEFKKVFGDDKELYESYMLPDRATKYSAGYDFYAIKDYVLKPGEIIKIPTGYKAQFGPDEMLLIVVRGGMGFNYNIRMTNQIGVVESDYYNNVKNEGHFYVSLQNEGTEEYRINKNDRYAQAIFTKFLICDDDNATGIRTGGFGSTNKKEGDKNE
ncbi:MAG: deoxyuridine 5'-triphosphate nucleotidohydrolase [Bacilli bacterium]|nr:deoxyuridine 5'-triphosphate nucleotidohydrolase [Bacilli bacterium]